MGFLVTFKQDACKGCELCMAFCAKKLIVADKSVLNKSGIHPAAITDTTQCVGCLNCTLMWKRLRNRGERHGKSSDEGKRGNG